ncbi:MAG: cytidylate kinase-like family protein [Acetatifactor sp.]|nr:cytidylate kinase-like family protein [Acetatifactor sp.]
MYHIITIERPYASGGNEIAKKLAEALGYKLFDRNILTEAAKNLDVPQIHINNLEETSSGSFIFNLSKTSKGNANENSLPMAEKLFAEEKRIIEKAADEGGCVIVGRAAGYILRDRTDCLRVFVHANNEFRIQRAVEREGINRADAENAIKKIDKRRKGFYDSVTKWKWGDPEFFEVCLDSSKLGIELCTKLLAEAVLKS